MALTFRLKLVHDPAGKVSSIGLLASGGRHGSLGFLGAEEMGRATRLLRNLWQALGSIQLAATLLAVLLLASLLASLFPQMPADPSAHESWLAAVALRYGPVTQLLHALDLFDAYRAPWFLALLALLLLNTLTCTLQRLPRLWRVFFSSPPIVRSDAFYTGFEHRVGWPVSSVGEGGGAAWAALARRRYRLRTEHSGGDIYLYAERGRWGRIGTLVSHIAALWLAVAVAARPVLGWQETGVTLLPGQVHAVGHGRDFAVQAGSLTVDRYPGGQPRGYGVPLTVLVGASSAMSRTVRINHPLTFRGVAFHLQGYGPAAQVTAAERTFDLAFTGGQVREVTLPDAGLTLQVAYQPEGAFLFVEVRGSDGTLLGAGTVADGERIDVRGTPISFALRRYTLWQVSYDPTFGPAVGAAGLFLLAAAVSLWSPHRRLWLRVGDQKTQMVGAGDFGGAFGALARALIGTGHHADPEGVQNQEGESLKGGPDG